MAVTRTHFTLGCISQKFSPSAALTELKNMAASVSDKRKGGHGLTRSSAASVSARARSSRAMSGGHRLGSLLRGFQKGAHGFSQRISRHVTSHHIRYRGGDRPGRPLCGF